MTSTASPSKAPAGNLNFVLVCVFIDMLGIGLIVPVPPALVGEYVAGRERQALWFGVLSAVFGLMQFLCMPLIGMASDRLGRRPVLLYSMAGMCVNFLSTAWAPPSASVSSADRRENGIALLCVGATSIVVQAVLLAALVRRLGSSFFMSAALQVAAAMRVLRGRAPVADAGAA